MADPSAYPPVVDNALIGDCRTAALVARDGSIDSFCPGQVDAPAAFCRLLDAGKGGYLRSAPVGAYSTGKVDPGSVISSPISGQCLRWACC
jgi:GH15 family glucan-1,4-alpha-glucosidase